MSCKDVWILKLEFATKTQFLCFQEEEGHFEHLLYNLGFHLLLESELFKKNNKNHVVQHLLPFIKACLWN